MSGMRFIVYGAGAIGGAIGGRLHQHGYETVLIARGRHLDALRDGGLVLRTPEETTTLRVPVAAGPEEVGLRPDDVVILAMKTQDTAAALTRLIAVAPPELAVVCAQNGVENERLALRCFTHVYGMYVVVPATHLEPGVVVAQSTPVTGILDLGRYPAGVDQVAEELAGALSASTFSARAETAIMRWKYAKLLTNLGNAVEAICGPEARNSDLVRQVQAEGKACLEAAGIEWAAGAEQKARAGELVRLRPVAGERRGGGSSWQSLARGAGSIETDWLNGEIVLRGRLHGVPTPLNAGLQRIADRMAADGVPPGTMTAEHLLALLA
jgi:2-dehydropantoate 2-reductase